MPVLILVTNPIIIPTAVLHLNQNMEVLNTTLTNQEVEEEDIAMGDHMAVVVVTTKGVILVQADFKCSTSIMNESGLFVVL